MASPPVLRYSANAPPVAVLAAARIGGVALTAVPEKEWLHTAAPTLTFEGGAKLSGMASLLRFVARSAPPATGLYGTDNLDATLVDHWLDQASAVVSGGAFQGMCETIAAYLATRTHLVGHGLTVADLAVWGQLSCARQWEAVKKAPALAHLVRWLDMCTAHRVISDVAAETVAARPGAKRAATQAQKVADNGSVGGGADAGGSFDINLENASEGNVVTRFPPEPSGFLHIGHAKAALLNQYFARQYKGKLIIRFDDTNPSKERNEFVESILADCATLGLDHDVVTYTSDSFPQILEIGAKLIREGKIYIDDTPMEKMREERINRVDSAARANTVEANLVLWGDMLAGNAQGLECAARFRMDMQNDNGALRDPVAFRCNLTPHHRTGTTYKVYPTYDCACPFVDSFEGVTHALRTSEYRDREPQYVQVQAMMGLRKVHIWDYSRLNFVYTTLSKRKLQWFVDNGHADSWDDPRFPTVQGMTRRGLRIDALKEFILMQGASRNVNLMEWDKLWTLNKRIIDPVCPRHVAVADLGRVLVTLTNGPATPEVVSVPRHKKHPPAGVKATTRMSRIWLEAVDAATVVEGEEVTLMDWGNCVIRTIHRNAAATIVGIDAELHLEGSVKSTKLKLTWLPDTAELVPLRLADFDYLITKKKVEEDDNFADIVNKHSKVESLAHGDANMRTFQKGDVLQLERKGYFIVDQVFMREGTPMVLLNIPDGRAKSWGVSVSGQGK